MSTYWTIDGFEQLTPQEIVERSASHIVAQGIRSYDGSRCLYDGPDGRTCGAGVFLKPEFRALADAIPGPSWKHLVELECVPKNNARLVQALQGMHDEPNAEQSADDFLFFYRPRIRIMCYDYGLEIPECCREE